MEFNIGRINFTFFEIPASQFTHFLHIFQNIVYIISNYTYICTAFR